VFDLQKQGMRELLPLSRDEGHVAQNRPAQGLKIWLPADPADIMPL
jgi:hypothetical protein